MRLEGKVVLITGSTSGIGEAIARRCLAEGARVLVHGLERDLAEKVAGSLGEAAALRVDDLLDPEAAPRLVEAALRAFGRIDPLVNNTSRSRRTGAASACGTSSRARGSRATRAKCASRF